MRGQPRSVDADHGATPLGWAEHGHAEATAEILRAQAPYLICRATATIDTSQMPVTK